MSRDISTPHLSITRVSAAFGTAKWLGAGLSPIPGTHPWRAALASIPLAWLPKKWLNHPAEGIANVDSPWWWEMSLGVNYPHHQRCFLPP